jgi:hypothetical protein
MRWRRLWARLKFQGLNVQVFHISRLTITRLQHQGFDIPGLRYSKASPFQDFGISRLPKLRAACSIPPAAVIDTRHFKERVE